MNTIAKFLQNSKHIGIPDDRIVHVTTRNKTECEGRYETIYSFYSGDNELLEAALLLKTDGAVGMKKGCFVIPMENIEALWIADEKERA